MSQRDRGSPALIVCHCKAVSDRTIRKVIRHGAETPREIARACGAGLTCGGCRPAVREVLESERERAHAAAEQAAALAVETPLVAAS